MDSWFLTDYAFSFIDLVDYFLKLAYRFRMPLYYDSFKPYSIGVFHMVDIIIFWCGIPSYLHFASI